MIHKQRGVVDPWTLGLLIGLTGLFVTQPWDKVQEKTLSDSSRIERSQDAYSENNN